MDLRNLIDFCRIPQLNNSCFTCMYTRDERVPGLPEIERRDKEAVQAMGEFQTVYGQYDQELRRATVNFERLAQEQRELEEWSRQLESVYRDDSSHWESKRRRELFDQWNEALRELEEINKTMRTLFQEIAELQRTMVVLASSLKKPEVGEA